MFIVALNLISLGKLFQIVTARFKKLRWPLKVVVVGLYSYIPLFKSVERRQAEQEIRSG